MSESDTQQDGGDEKVVIGKFGRAHGTRGELRLWCYHAESPLFERDVIEGWARDEQGELTVVKIVQFRWADRFALVRLKGVGLRWKAEEYINQELVVERSVFEELEDDELYLIDTIGWPALIDHDGARYEVGVIEGYLDSGAYDLMRIALKGGGSWLVPVLDHCLVELVPDGGRVVLAKLEQWAPADVTLPVASVKVEESA